MMDRSKIVALCPTDDCKCFALLSDEVIKLRAALRQARNDALEEVVKVVDNIRATIYDDDLVEVGRLQACREIAAAIRALIPSEEPPGAF